MGCSKSSPKREVYSSTILPQGTRNMSNKQTHSRQEFQHNYNMLKKIEEKMQKNNREF